MIANGIKRGTAELAVLSVLENGALHGYEIARRIEHETRGALRFTLAALYPTAFPVGLLMEWVTGWPADFRDVAAVFLKAPVGSLLVPGVALLLGGLPVELFLSRGVTPPKSAIS